MAFFFEFVIDLDPFVDLEAFIDLETFVMVLDPFGLALALDALALDIVDSDVVDLDPFVLASCAARLAKSSCLLAQPVCSKIRLMIGEVSSSSSMVAELDPCLVIASVVDVRESFKLEGAFKLDGQE